MDYYSKSYTQLCLYFLSYLVEMALTSQVKKLTVFKPTDIQGCAVWFDAYDSTTVTLSGSNVTSWQSKGYNAIEATASGALRPTYSNYTPGNPGLYFNGANKMTTGGATYGTLGMTWITASLETVRATADAAAILATNGAGAERSVRYNVNVGDANIYTINSSVLRQLTGNNTPGIRGFTDTAASFTAYVNGTATTTNTAVTYQPAVNQGFQLGQWNIGYLTGFIFECIVYDTALSLNDYRKVEGYLAWKWGFQASLASGHPYLTNAFAPIFPRLPYTIPMTIKQTKDSVPPYFARASGQIFKPISVTATGGTITFANVSGIDYRIHTFTTVGTANFTLTSPASVITTVLVVAGGGAGGFDDGGGGGAGGVIYNAAFTITSGSYTVTVGNGGASNGASGGNSILSSLTAIGGGGGANGNANGSNGGSGGGLGWGVGNGSTPGSGTAGQGFAGGGGTSAPNYAVGGGGGAGGVGGTGSGITPGNGGIGVSHTIAGTTYNVGGGGGGGLAGQNSSGTNSTASFGGGNGAGQGANAAVAGTANTGGGGGGANNMQATNGAFGGSGIVIIAYQYQ